MDSIEPLTDRLNEFRLNGIGCDVVFIVGEEQEVIIFFSNFFNY